MRLRRRGLRFLGDRVVYRWRVAANGRPKRVAANGPCPARNIRLQSQGKGAHPWKLARRHGVARGIFNRLREDARFVGRAMLDEVQYRLDTMSNYRGFSAS